MGWNHSVDKIQLLFCLPHSLNKLEHLLDFLRFLLNESCKDRQEEFVFALE